MMFGFNVRKKLYLKRLVLLLVLVLFVGFTIGGLVLHFSVSKIDKVLESDSYSYLPLEAKNYIRDVYEESGEIILTEKNKEVNVPYLNPMYVDYLSLSDSDKENVSIVPDAYILDYVYTGEGTSEELPSSYDLRNVDGKNYITPLKYQGSLGICWAFSALEQAESYLLVKNNISYDETSQLFSVRQLDYATSTNGIKNYTNEFGRRELAAGGNFEIASEIMSYGVSMIDEDKMPINYSVEQKELNEVLNYNNSNYEIDGTMSVPRISRTLSYDPVYKDLCTDEEDVDTCYDELEAQLKTEYISSIKNKIKNYGGGSVGTTSPDGACAFKNIDGSYVINSRDTCYSSLEGHAMHVIGWDDNYSYSYCDLGNTYTNVVDGSCTSGSLVEGTGAFLLRNSWGESSPYAYVYLTYDSIYNGAYSASFDFITDLSSMTDRVWDNNYPASIDYSRIYLAKRFSQEFTKKTDGDEKLEKIKFTTLIQNGVFTISIVSGDKTYTVSSYETSYPGIYTVDLSDKNIVVSDGFTVTISGTDYYLISKSISAYTSNVDEVPVIATSDITTEATEFIVYSDTKNINEGEAISYSLFDGEKELVDYLEVSNNLVTMNKVNASIKIVKEIKAGTYTLKLSYGDYVYSTNLVLDLPYNFDGSGTESDPYLIYNEEDLKHISEYLDANYKLVSDIELSLDWVGIGTLDNPFTGGFDGNDYSISGLNVGGELEYSGLFGYVSNSTNTYIKNVVIKDAVITGSGDSGSLIGHLLVENTGSMIIDSIYVYGGSVSGNNAGSIIGAISGVNYDKASFNIGNLFSSSEVSGSSSAGVIGSIYEYQGDNMSISNIQNIGITISSDTSLYSSHSSSLIGHVLPYYNVSNFVITGFTKMSDKSFSGLIGASDSINGSNGYYVKGINDVFDYTNADNGVYGVNSSTDLTNADNYTSWNYFEDNWVIETVDGVSRIPVLKGVDFTYTTVSNITVEPDKTVSLLDYITPVTDAAQIKFETSDSSIVDVSYVYENSTTYPSDITVKGLKGGTTVIHMVSDYDGYVGDIEVVVNADPVIYYHSNNGVDEVINQTIEKNTSFVLNENTFEKEGYLFKEWNTLADGSGVSYSDVASISGLESDLNLYAQWSPIEYSIEYVYLFKDSSSIFNTQTLVYDASSNILDYTGSEVGYKFSGWTVSADGSGTKYSNGQSVVNLTNVNGKKISLYTLWDAITYNVSFDSNGGEGSMSSISATYDKEFTILENTFTKVGYKFKDWNTKSDGTGTSYSESVAYKNLTNVDNGSVTLYAQWVACDYIVSFDSNGGTGSMSSISVTYDKEFTILENTFTKVGYKFKEWNTKSDGTGASYSPLSVQKNLTLDEKVTLYAIWEAINYNVIFDSNGGEGTMNNQIMTYDQEVALDENVFVKDGFVFSNWNTKVDGSGTSYSDKALVKNLTSGDDITLYAIWVEGFDYTIKEYVVDSENSYIDKIPVNTTLDEYKKNIEVGVGYSVVVDLGDNSYINTGSKTQIYKGNSLEIEFTNIVRGEVTGDGKVNYLDYVNVYNHIYKTKNPDSDRKLLVGEYLVAADMSGDEAINYLDYVKLYNLIKQLKGGN